MPLSWVAASGHGDGTDPPLHGSSRIRNSVLKLSSFSVPATLVTGCKPTLAFNSHLKTLLFIFLEQVGQCESDKRMQNPLQPCPMGSGAHGYLQGVKGREWTRNQHNAVLVHPRAATRSSLDGRKSYLGKGDEFPRLNGTQSSPSGGMRQHKGGPRLQPGKPA